MATQAAPGRLELVRAFVNSVDLEDGPEQLGSPSALAAWLRAHDLPAGRVTAAGLEHALALREALRELLLARHGDHEADPAAARTLDEAAQRAGLRVRFGAAGAAALAPTASGLDGALGELLAIVAEAQRDGTWKRLKACPWESCRWAFYDHSKNRSGRWCRMEVCGNRAKAAAFRARARAARPTAGTSARAPARSAARRPAAP
jgi:predicted RNA-binding Zn ribbon-like protein